MQNLLISNFDFEFLVKLQNSYLSQSKSIALRMR